MNLFIHDTSPYISMHGTEKIFCLYVAEEEDDEGEGDGEGDEDEDDA
jgi:hypothetical protein